MRVYLNLIVPNFFKAFWTDNFQRKTDLRYFADGGVSTCGFLWFHDIRSGFTLAAIILCNPTQIWSVTLKSSRGAKIWKWSKRTLYRFLHFASSTVLNYLIFHSDDCIKVHLTFWAWWKQVVQVETTPLEPSPLGRA